MDRKIIAQELLAVAREIMAASIVFPTVGKLVSSLEDSIESGYKKGSTDEDTLRNQSQWLSQVSVGARMVAQSAKGREYSNVRRAAKQIVKFCVEQRDSGLTERDFKSGRNPVPYLNQRVEDIIDSMPDV